MKHLTPAVAIALLRALLFAACGDNITGPPEADPKLLARGTFEATVSGDVNATLRGCTTFLSDNTNGAFTLAMFQGFDDGTWAAVELARGDLSLPVIGTYAIGESAAADSPQNFVGMFFWQSPPSPYTFISKSGKLTIETSNGRSLTGTFNFTAAEIGSSTTINISGKFNAIPFHPGWNRGTPCG